MARQKKAEEGRGILDLFEVLVDASPSVAPKNTSGRPSYVVGPPPRSPRDLDCGHANLAVEAAHMEARAAGFCCAGARDHRPVRWQFLRGEYLKPLPEAVRRAPGRTTGAGFPGYCCDAQGWYIGGIGNYCVAYRPAGAPICTAHVSENGVVVKSTVRSGEIS